MSRTPDDVEAAYSGEFSMPPYCPNERDHVDLDAVIRANEDRQAAVDNDYPDSWGPVEDESLGWGSV